MKEWIIGRNAVYETLRAGRRSFYRLWISEQTHPNERLDEIERLGEQRGLEAEAIREGQISAFGEDHQGVALQVGAYPYVDIEDILKAAEQKSEPLWVLILDQLQDPQNLGSLLRTAEAVGVHGVILPQKRTASVTPSVVRTSAGASEYLQIASMNLAQAIARIKRAGGWTVGLEAGANPSDPQQLPLTGPLALVVGSEGEGMRSLVRGSCDFLWSLPMRGQVSSLNAAVAGSVALYTTLFQRQAQPAAQVQ
jgi:23S rRNA (guanosine2251-2'-O)-methyltransferase